MLTTPSSHHFVTSLTTPTSSEHHNIVSPHLLRSMLSSLGTVPQLGDGSYGMRQVGCDGCQGSVADHIPIWPDLPCYGRIYSDSVHQACLSISLCPGHSIMIIVWLVRTLYASYRRRHASESQSDRVSCMLHRQQSRNSCPERRSNSIK